MVSNGTSKQRSAANNNEVAFIRQEDAPILPPPAISSGAAGWLYENIFASMLDYSSLGAAVTGPPMPTRSGAARSAAAVVVEGFVVMI